jgi:hypothetical protein
MFRKGTTKVQSSLMGWSASYPNPQPISSSSPAAPPLIGRAFFSHCTAMPKPQGRTAIQQVGTMWEITWRVAVSPVRS